MRVSLLGLAASASLTATVAFAECPAWPAQSERQTAIIASLQAAPNEAAARPLSNLLWEIWAEAPDAEAQGMLDTGMAALRIGDFQNAISSFDALVTYCPDYAEGYNQRAFANFLQQNFEPALADLDRAIERSPRHIAAIAGKGLTLLGLGRKDEAQKALKEAVALNPWLSERHLIEEEPGTDL